MHDFQDLLKNTALEMGVELQGDLTEIRMYAAERAAVLATLVGQPGYELAMIAERDNVALKMGLMTVEIAERARQRFLGIIQTVLFMGAGVLGGGQPNA